MRTTEPSTTSPCLKLLISESCSARSSAIVVGSGPVGTGFGAGAGAAVSGSAGSGSRARARGLGGGLGLGHLGASRAPSTGPQPPAARPRPRRARPPPWLSRWGLRLSRRLQAPPRAQPSRTRSARPRRLPRLPVPRTLSGLLLVLRCPPPRPRGSGWWRARRRRPPSPTGCSDVGASADASAGGIVPPCCSSVNSVSCPRTPSNRNGPSATPRPSVLRSSGPSDGGPRSAPSWSHRDERGLVQFRPEGPAESSTPEYGATIAPPCPNCPIWRSSRTPSTLRFRAGGSCGRRRPPRSPSAARRPSWPPWPARSCARSAGAASSSSSSSIGIGSPSTRC